MEIRNCKPTYLLILYLNYDQPKRRRLVIGNANMCVTLSPFSLCHKPIMH